MEEYIGRQKLKNIFKKVNKFKEQYFILKIQYWLQEQSRF